MFCPKCGVKVNPQNNKCPYCKFDFSNTVKLVEATEYKNNQHLERGFKSSNPLPQNKSSQDLISALVGLGVFLFLAMWSCNLDTGDTHRGDEFMDKSPSEWTDRDKGDAKSFLDWMDNN